MSPKSLAVLALILTACVPHATNAVHSPAPVSAQKPAAVGSYVLYLQAKQDMDYKTAINFLYTALKEDPNNPILESEMFSLLAIEGRLDEAYPFAQTELKKTPDSLLAALVVVAYHAKNGSYNLALEQIDKFPSKDENAFLFPLLEVWIQAGLNDKKKALQALNKLNQSGTESLYYFHSALLNDMWNNEDEARQGYEALLNEPGGLSLRAAQAYGNFLLRQGNSKKFQALVDAYRKSAKSYPLIDEMFFTAGSMTADRKVPLSVPDPTAGLAESFFDISGSLADKGSPESSLFFIRFGLALDPSLSLARILLGEILEKQGRNTEALELYESEDQHSETYFASQVRAANILAREGKLTDAEKKLRSLADKRNDSSFPWVQLGEIFLSEKQYQKAVDAFNEAINRTGALNRSHWLLFYSRGVSYERAGEWQSAEEDLQKALMLAPEQPLILNYLGYSWLERGKNISDATKMLEKAAYLAPEDGFIADSLGWAYYLRKNYQKAAEILEIAISIDPGSAVINDHLGDTYWRIGRKREAEFQWKKALTVNDDLPNGDRQRVEMKLAQGLDAVGDKVNVPPENKKIKKKKK